ncbi:MAG: 3-deoxy-8-phosphooctulonate synthase [Myxococcota bacterium]|nr:3-deoxy-8-phosphooctulonate synthase [Myxococcota bacterium]
MHTSVEDLFLRRKLTLIAGPCAAESAELCEEVATRAKELCERYGVSYIFKASFDKANRSSIHSYRGPGLSAGLETLSHIKNTLGLPVLTDIHEPSQAAPVAEVVDVLQIPAFLCRQTDLVAAAAKTGRPTCIKKGQFLAPEAMQHAVKKFRESSGSYVALTERGTTFGYDNLVVDMRSLESMRQSADVPVIFDATHSVQRPGGSQGVTGGDRTLVPLLARAAAAVGIDGLFCEVHANPDEALSDGPNSLTFELLEQVLREVTAIDDARQRAQSPQS